MANDTVGINVRYLLWREVADRRIRPAVLAEWASCGMERAVAILHGAPPRAEEIARIAKKASRSAKELGGKYLPAADGVDVRAENVRFLVGSLEREAKGDFSKAVGFHPATISAWRSGRQRPEKPGPESVCRYFGLPAETDPRTEPVFLSWSPVGAARQKRWLQDRIGGLRQERLNRLFPALELLLKDE